MDEKHKMTGEYTLSTFNKITNAKELNEYIKYELSKYGKSKFMDIFLIRENSI